MASLLEVWAQGLESVHARRGTEAGGGCQAAQRGRTPEAGGGDQSLEAAVEGKVGGGGRGLVAGKGIGQWHLLAPSTVQAPTLSLRLQQL